MQTTKLSLYGQLRNSLLLILLCVSASSLAQDAGIDRSRNNLTSNFSSATVTAYRESSIDKVAEFYQYLNLLSDLQTAADLKNQALENILTLFTDRNIMVTDLTSSQLQKIPLQHLLNKISGSDIKFNLEKQRSDSKLGLNCWKNDYVINVISSKETFQKSMSQNVYLMPKDKKFGSNSKEVWSMLLGEFVESN